VLKDQSCPYYLQSGLWTRADVQGDSKVSIHRDEFNGSAVSGLLDWSPWPPGLTPLDFYLWCHLKATVYQVKIQYVDHLKERIRDACDRVTPDVNASSS
jgi:hypothetical protein